MLSLLSSLEGPFVVIIVWVVLIVVIILLVKLVKSVKKKVKDKHSRCPKCKNLYKFPKDFSIISGELKWRKENITKSSNGVSYETSHLIYYRIVTFNYKCSNCGDSHWQNKTYDLYWSDSNHSQSPAEEIELLKTQIRKDFNNEVFSEQDVSIGNIDY
jgi:hypothetical protein